MKYLSIDHVVLDLLWFCRCAVCFFFVLIIILCVCCLILLLPARIGWVIYFTIRDAVGLFNEIRSFFSGLFWWEIFFNKTDSPTISGSHLTLHYRRMHANWMAVCFFVLRIKNIIFLHIIIIIINEHSPIATLRSAISGFRLLFVLEFVALIFSVLCKWY